MTQNLLQVAGGQPQKQPKFVPIFIDKAFTGIYTQRNVLHDPGDFLTSRFYGGRPDALWLGSSNVELTNRLTLQRRPGLTPFSISTYPTPPDRAYAFELTNGTIQVMIDTVSTGELNVTSIASSTGSSFAVVHSYSGNSQAGIVVTSAPSTANKLILAAGVEFTSSAPVTITDTVGNIWTLVSSNVSVIVAGSFSYYLYICENPIASTTTVTLNTSGSTIGHSLGAII